ncbi:unnamed protein product [Symbiodinium sp. CCMP2592]|nr:unnamed protein product [Symbiodinium sp. CCMP2592]
MLMNPYILRTWEHAVAGETIGENGNGALSYFESDFDLMTVKECLTTFHASFATRKEGTLFSVFPKAKLSASARQLADKLRSMVPLDREDDGTPAATRRDFMRELLADAPPEDDAAPIPIVNAVRDLHIVGFKAGYRQAGRTGQFREVGWVGWGPGTVHYVIGNSSDMNMQTSFELPSIIAYAKTEDALKQEEEPAMWGSLLPGDCLYVPPGAITVFKVHGSAAIFLRSQSAVTPGHTFMRVVSGQLCDKRSFEVLKRALQAVRDKFPDEESDYFDDTFQDRAHVNCQTDKAAWHAAACMVCDTVSLGHNGRTKIMVQQGKM